MELFERTARSGNLRGEHIIFSGGAEQELGLPDLGTVSRFAREQGLEVVHIGYGCFDIRTRFPSVNVASFLGGGAMMNHADDAGSWIVSSSMLDFHGDLGKQYMEKWVSFISGLRGVSECWSKISADSKKSDMNSELADGRW